RVFAAVEGAEIAGVLGLAVALVLRERMRVIEVVNVGRRELRVGARCRPDAGGEQLVSHQREARGTRFGVVAVGVELLGRNGTLTEARFQSLAQLGDAGSGREGRSFVGVPAGPERLTR